MLFALRVLGSVEEYQTMPPWFASGRDPLDSGSVAMACLRRQAEVTLNVTV